MELIDRIKVVMKVNQLSASQLADEIGVQRSNVSHVLSGRNKPSFEFIHKLLVRFPRVNAHWLITGQSQPENEDSTEINRPSPKEQSGDLAASKSTLPKPESTEEVERIVFFYKDGTFRDYANHGSP